MSIFNSVWGLIALAVLAGIIFVQAGKVGGNNQSGGTQTASILGAAGDALSGLITSIETGSAPSGGGQIGRVR